MVYDTPKMKTVVIVPQKCILDVSKPGGSVTPLDPNNED